MVQKSSFITPDMLPNFVKNNKEMDEKQKIIDGLRKQVADLEALGYQQVALLRSCCCAGLRSMPAFIS